MHHFTASSLSLKEKRVPKEAIAPASHTRWNPNYKGLLWNIRCYHFGRTFFYVCPRLGKGQLGDSAQARPESSAAALITLNKHGLHFCDGQLNLKGCSGCHRRALLLISFTSNLGSSYLIAILIHFCAQLLPDDPRICWSSNQFCLEM